MKRLLDICCCGGGASKGYQMVGFDVVGVDIIKKRNYPFEFIKGNGLELDMEFLDRFDAIHASPPCQTHSRTKHLRNAQGRGTTKLDLIEPMRAMLVEWGGPWVMENVPGAPLKNPVLLCGSAFGLKVRRHRLFESNMGIVGTVCDHRVQGRPVGVYGSMNDEIPQGGRTAKSLREAQEAMGIDWLGWGDLVEAIPPAYTEFIGRQIMGFIGE